MTTPHSLGQLVRTLLDRIDPAVERAYRAGGLDYRPRYTPVLRALAQHGPMRIKDIADAQAVSHSALSQTVSTMVARGWLRTMPGKDARERILHLTPKARSALPRLQAQWLRTATAARSLSAEVGVSLEDTLAKAIAALDRQSFDERLAAAKVAEDGNGS